MFSKFSKYVLVVSIKNFVHDILQLRNVGGTYLFDDTHIHPLNKRTNKHKSMVVVLHSYYVSKTLKQKSIHMNEYVQTKTKICL
jgi:hypothetical protein